MMLLMKLYKIYNPINKWNKFKNYMKNFNNLYITINFTYKLENDGRVFEDLWRWCKYYNKNTKNGRELSKQAIEMIDLIDEIKLS